MFAISERGWELAEYKAAVKNAAFLRRVRPQLDASDTDDLNALAVLLVKKLKVDDVKEEKHAKPAKPPAAEDTLAADTLEAALASGKAELEGIALALAERLVEDKFSYGGASARYLFAFSTERVRNDIKRFVGACTNPKALLSGAVGDQSPEAIHHLSFNWRRPERDVQSIVSLFATRLLAEKADEEFFSLAASYEADLGQAFAGHIFQARFISLLKARRQVNLNVKGVPVLTGPDFKTPEVCCLFALTNLCPCYPAESCLVVGWPGVAHHRQGGAVLSALRHRAAAESIRLAGLHQGQRGLLRRSPARRRHHLRAVQLTVAKQHSFKLRFLIKLVDALDGLRAPLKISRILFSFVVPTAAIATQFKADRPEGYHPSRGPFGERFPKLEEDTSVVVFE